MRGTTGKCPGCDGSGVVAEPCPERGCQKRNLHFISNGHWKRAHPDDGSTPDPVIGQRVGDFLVVDRIGVGGFGKVYLAFQSPLLRLKGALKLIDVATNNPEFSRALLEKFQSEAEVLAHLTHPNIVRLLKYGIHAKRPYLVMEYVDGRRTLRDEIHTRTVDDRGFSADEILDVFNQVLNGLGAAHEESIIHRDIKPENIMLQSVVGNPHHVRLLDFGLAKFVEHRTDTRWHLGSPNYMAPEQISRKNLGPWTDLYAVTVMLFELLTGRRPFPGSTDEQVLIYKVKDDFDPISQIADLDFPKPTLKLLTDGLARDPEKRFRDVESLRAQLEPAVEAVADRLGPTGKKLSAKTAQLGSDDIIEVLESGDEPPSDELEKTRRASSDTAVIAEAKEAAGETAVATEAVKVPDNDEQNDDEQPAVQDKSDAAAESNKAPKAEPTPSTQDSPPEDEKEPRSRLPLIAGIFGITLAGLIALIVVVGAVSALAPASPDHDEEESFDDPAESHASAAPPAALETADPTPTEETAAAASPVDAGSDTDVAADVDTDVNADVAGAVDDDRLILDMALGKFHTCILLRGGDVRCWGANFDAELGLGHRQPIGDTEPASTADFVNIGEPAIALTAAGDRQASFTCALLESRDMRCWGSNHFGQLGQGTDIARIGEDELPADVDVIDVGGPVKKMASGAMQYATHACALLEDGDLRCWGNNRYGQLGLGHSHHIGRSELPANVNAVNVGGDIADVVAGKFHTCVLLDSGDVRCWGRNNTGQLGYGHTDQLGDTENPADLDPVDVGGAVEQISAGRGHTCALLDEGRARCWGWNAYGQLGYGHDDNVGADGDAPADAGDIDIGSPVEYISAGGLHTCALLEDGRVRCWGDNRFGQLGYGHRRTIGIDDVPADATDVYIGGRAVALEAANYHTCVILEDDSLRCWGFNNFGQLGFGHTETIGDTEAPASAGPVPAFEVSE